MTQGKTLGKDGIGTYNVDKMIGTNGNDFFHIDSIQDTVSETSSKGGYDTIVVESDFKGFAAQFTMGSSIEALDMSAYDIEAILNGLVDGNSYTQNDVELDLLKLKANKTIINGNTANNLFTLNDKTGSYIKILAGAGNDTIYGGKGDDYIDGGAGNDTIYGGDGNNTIIGGAGDDTYVLSSHATNAISDTTGIDTLKLIAGNDGWYSPSYVNLDNYSTIENIDASIVEAEITIIGNALNNTIKGCLGNDQMSGMAGDDTLISGEGNDYLNGGSGNNKLVGGSGNDIYHVDIRNSKTQYQMKADKIKLFYLTHTIKQQRQIW